MPDEERREVKREGQPVFLPLALPFYTQTHSMDVFYLKPVVLKYCQEKTTGGRYACQLLIIRILMSF